MGKVKAAKMDVRAGMTIDGKNDLERLSCN
jgi:hypothetical protein